MNTVVPKEDVDGNNGPKLRAEQHLFHRSQCDRASYAVTCPLEPLDAQIDVVLFEHPSIRLLGRSRDEKIAQKANGNRDDGADDIHPSPAGETIDSVESCGGAGLNETCRQGAQGETDVEDATSAGNLVSSVP